MSKVDLELNITESNCDRLYEKLVELVKIEAITQQQLENVSILIGNQQLKNYENKTK